MKQNTISLINIIGGVIIILWALFGLYLSSSQGFSFTMNDDVAFLVIGLLALLTGIFLKQKNDVA